MTTFYYPHFLKQKITNAWDVTQSILWSQISSPFSKWKLFKHLETKLDLIRMLDNMEIEFDVNLQCIVWSGQKWYMYSVITLNSITDTFWLCRTLQYIILIWLWKWIIHHWHLCNCFLTFHNSLHKVWLTFISNLSLKNLHVFQKVTFVSKFILIIWVTTLAVDW